MSVGRLVRRNAFTLIELLVVIGIISILVGLLLAALHRARNTGYRIACMSALRQYAAANQMYLNEFDDWYMPIKWGFNPNPLPPWPPPPPGLPAPTIATQSWPSNAAFRRNLGERLTHSRVPYGLICPKAVLAMQSATKQGYEVPRSYGYNSTGLGWYDGPTIYYTGFKRRQVRSPALKLMFVDATDHAVNYSASDRYLRFGEVYGPPDPMPRTGITAYRHERGANVMYFDGHAEWLAREKIVLNKQLWYVMR